MVAFANCDNACFGWYSDCNRPEFIVVTIYLCAVLVFSRKVIDSYSNQIKKHLKWMHECIDLAVFCWAFLLPILCLYKFFEFIIYKYSSSMTFNHFSLFYYLMLFGKLIPIFYWNLILTKSMNIFIESVMKFSLLSSKLYQVTGTSLIL